MHNTLLLQLIKKDLEEIQTLIHHFEQNPQDLETGMELASSKMDNLSREFQMLQQNIGTAKVTPTPKEETIADEITVAKSAEPVTPTNQETAPETDYENSPTADPDMDFTKESQPLSQKEKNSIIVSEETPEILGQKLSAKGVSDIRSAIGINDRFLFIRELFNNQTEEYRQTIEFLNNSDSLSEAMDWLNSKYSWDLENPFVLQFLDITKRKFN